VTSLKIFFYGRAEGDGVRTSTVGVHAVASVRSHLEPTTAKENRDGPVLDAGRNYSAEELRNLLGCSIGCDVKICERAPEKEISHGAADKVGFVSGFLEDWIAETDSGDMDEYYGPLPAELRHKLTISSDDCLHRNCPKFNDCWAEEAKIKASEAQIVVVNHALLMIDLDTRGVLPPYDHLVIDEAHHLADATANIQEISLSINRVNNVLRANVAKVSLFPQDIAGRISSMFYVWFEGFAERLGTNDREGYEWPLAYFTDLLESLQELLTWWMSHGQAVKDRISEMTVYDQKLREISMEQITKEVDRLWDLFEDFHDLANASQATDYAYWIQRDRTKGNFTYSLHRT
ncbi:hypothetical protein LCGC14_3093950, partial [marine sediment metagenome]